MKIQQLFASIGIAITICLCFMAFKPAPTAKNYKHMFIIAEHHDLDNVLISIDGKEYKRLNLVKQRQGVLDLNPMINLIDQYENEGWELVETNINVSQQSYRLRKE